MTITISGHTIPITSVEHADKLCDRADQFRADDDQDGLENWLYAGCPLELPPEQITESAEGDQ